MTVNLFHPEFWIEHGHWDYLNQTPGKSGRWGDFEYYINSNTRRNSDFLVVHEDIDRITIRKVMRGGLVLITGEERSIKNYNQDFLDQFDIVITSREDIQHSYTLKTHYLHPWWIKKTYDELVDIHRVDKSLELSAIISSLTSLPRHKERYAFINKLKGHYKDKIDWFSKGESTFITDKWEGLRPYKYSIAIENSVYKNYFTEKISDCFLSFCMPFYSGCPNINEFFDDRSFITIFPQNFMESIEIIDDAINNDLYNKNLKFITESRRLVLEKYHLIAALSELLSTVERNEKVHERTIYPQTFFNKGPIEKIVRSSFRRFI